MKPDQKTVFWFILGPKYSSGKRFLDRKKDLVSQEDYDGRIKTVMKQINKLLRKMAFEVGITQHMTTYVARHSFASVLKHQGIPTDQISELLGHDSVKTTKIYLQNFEEESLNEAVRKLL